ncbi:hypothetical protein DFH06DRAFT_1131036 [Mycena polygramma]|nr:hypothetical protein DFH06DRAFT_1131036 [Mycena polygramma]
MLVAGREHGRRRGSCSRKERCCSISQVTLNCAQTTPFDLETGRTHTIAPILGEEPSRGGESGGGIGKRLPGRLQRKNLRSDRIDAEDREQGVKAGAMAAVVDAAAWSVGSFRSAVVWILEEAEGGARGGVAVGGERRVAWATGGKSAREGREPQQGREASGRRRETACGPRSSGPRDERGSDIECWGFVASGPAVAWVLGVAGMEQARRW